MGRPVGVGSQIARRDPEVMKTKSDFIVYLQLSTSMLEPDLVGYGHIAPV